MASCIIGSRWFERCFERGEHATVEILSTLATSFVVFFNFILQNADTPLVSFFFFQKKKYATAYIDAHILFLRNFTADLQPLPSDTASSSTRRPPISEEHMRRLADVRRDIVHTIRQVVDIVSKYAGGALPEPAKTRVRGFILTLPQRWASKAGGTGGGVNGVTSVAVAAGAGAGGSERDSTVTAAASGTGATRRMGGQRRAALRERGPSNINGIDGSGLRSGTPSRAPSPSSPRVSRTAVNSHLRHGSGGDVGEGGSGDNGRVSAGTALVAAQRILALATESLDMMRNVTGVMKDSLDRAEAYVFLFFFFDLVDLFDT